MAKALATTMDVRNLGPGEPGPRCDLCDRTFAQGEDVIAIIYAGSRDVFRYHEPCFIDPDECIEWVIAIPNWMNRPEVSGPDCHGGEPADLMTMPWVGLWIVLGLGLGTILVWLIS